MRFDAEFGNIFNRTDFCNPNTNFSAGSFGTDQYAMQPAALDSVWLEVHLLVIMETRLRRLNRRSLGAIGDVVAGAGFGRVFVFAATASLWSFFLLSAATQLRADAREALQKAVALVQEGRLEEADQQAQLALSNPQTRAVAYSVLGAIRFQQKRLPESVSLLEKAIRLDPRLLGAQLSLAEVYSVQGKSEAGSCALPPRPHSGSIECFRKSSLWRVQRPRRGTTGDRWSCARPVLPALKQSPDGLLLLAMDYLQTGDRHAAASLAKDWAGLADVPQAWSIKFALMLAEGEAIPEAIDILERIKTTATPSYELAFNLAGLYLMKSDPVRALENYDLALTLNPQSVPALRQAAGIAESSGELERSLSYWIRAKKDRT